MARESTRCEGGGAKLREVYADTWKIQARASIRNGEPTPDGLRETLIMFAPYAGCPNAWRLVAPCEEVISNWEADGEPGPATPAS